MTATGTVHYLEAVRKFCGELFLGLFEEGEERGALDADDLGNRLITDLFSIERAESAKLPRGEQVSLSLCSIV